MKIKIVIYTCLLFLIETLSQILYYTLKIKYFNLFHKYDNILEIFSDSTYVIGSFKIVFYLPIYLIFYLTNKERNKLFVSLYHALIFFCIYMLSIFFLPGVLRSFLDIVILTVISFISSLVVNMPLKSVGNKGGQ